MKNFFTVSFLISFLFLLAPVFAQINIQDFFSIDYFLTGVLGIPADELTQWTKPGQFLFNFALPLAGLFAIVLGFMRAMHIFETQDTVQIVIAFIMVFLTLPSKIFITFVQYTFQFGAIFAYVMFLVMFIGGAYFTTKGFIHGQQGRARLASSYSRMMQHYNSELRGLTDKKWEYEEKIAELTQKRLDLNPAAPDYYEKETNLKWKIDRIKEELTEITTNAQTARDKINSLKTTMREHHEA